MSAPGTGATRLSVVVPTRNSATTLGDLLVSLWDQEPRPEIIVVDNHSTDRTRLIAERFADRVIVAGGERSAQRNVGWRAAAGNVVVFLDSDMEVDPGFTRAVLDVFGDPGGLLAGILPELSDGCGIWGRARRLEKRLYLGTGVEAARVFTRRVLEVTGGWDERIVGGEDWDLTDRARAAGARIVRVPTIVTHHDGHIRLREAFRRKHYYGATSRPGALQGGRLWRTGVLAPLAGAVTRDPVAVGALVVLKATEAAGFAAGTRRRDRQGSRR